MKAAVLFDLFGTLVPSPPRDGYRNVVDQIADIAGLPRDEFFEAWMSVNDGRLSGAFGSSEGEIEHVVGMFGVSLTGNQIQESVRLRRSAMTSWLKPKPGAVETLEELIRAGHSLGLVSDCVFDVPAIWPVTPMAGLLPVTVFSCELGIRKPDERMYLAALEGLQAEPSTALFVGDGGSDELAGAQRVGIQSLLLADQPEDLSTVLRVDVHQWDGPSVCHISEVVEVAASIAVRL